MRDRAIRYGVAIGKDDDDVGYLNAKASVSIILREEIEKMFSGQNTLMEDLVGLPEGEEVQQAAHQATYLRNLIGNQVGLVEPLRFDAHTQTLYVGLVEASLQQALEKFYGHFSPASLIKRVDELYCLGERQTIDRLRDMGIIEVMDSE